MAPLCIFKKSLRSAYPIFSCAFCSSLFKGFSPHFPLQSLTLCRPITSKISAEQDDPTVSYLINSWGLSPEAAIVASQKVKVRSLEKPDLVLALLRCFEFSTTQISSVVKRQPRLLVANATENLLPKLEFFSSIGVSRLDLARILCCDQGLLRVSLQNQIIPSYNFFKSVVLSDEKVISILKCNSRIFKVNLSKIVIPNIGLLRELGMPQSCIALLLASHPHIFMRRHEMFSKIVDEVKEMGFDHNTLRFGSAIHMLFMKKSIWNQRQEVYKRWGWSENDVLSAFRRDPMCMGNSDEKIMTTMDFLVNKMGCPSATIIKCPKVLGLSLEKNTMKTVDFLVNKMGWPSATITKYPKALCLSLEKRIIPRCSVVKVLLLKGLVSEKLSLGSVLFPAENHFLERFVSRYLDQLPQLLNVYQGKVDIQDL